LVRGEVGVSLDSNEGLETWVESFLDRKLERLHNRIIGIALIVRLKGDLHFVRARG